MRSCLFVFIAALAFAAEPPKSAPIPAPVPTQNAPVPVSDKSAAEFWRTRSVMQDADFNDKAAHDGFNASIESMRAECNAMKPARDLNQDEKGRPVCIVRPSSSISTPAKK